MHQPLQIVCAGALHVRFATLPHHSHNCHIRSGHHELDWPLISSMSHSLPHQSFPQQVELDAQRSQALVESPPAKQKKCGIKSIPSTSSRLCHGTGLHFAAPVPEFRLELANPFVGVLYTSDCFACPHNSSSHAHWYFGTVVFRSTLPYYYISLPYTLV